MIVRPLSRQDIAAWNKLVEKSPDAWIFHDIDWVKATEKIWGLTDKSFWIEHNNTMAAIVPIQMRPNLKLTSIYIGTGGCAVDDGFSSALKEKLYKFAYAHIEHIGQEHNSPGVEIFLAPLAPSQLSSQWQVNPLVKYFYEDTSTHTWMADLTKEKAAVLKDFSDDAKQQVKKAVKHGFQVDVYLQTDESLFKDVFAIHQETYKRSHIAPHPREYFEIIFDPQITKKRAVLFLAKDKSGHPAAYAIIGFFKKGAQYWAGGCLNAHLESGVNYLLQQTAMLWAKDNGAKWFNQGEAFPNIREGKLRGLSVFKGKFGGELHRNFKGILKLRDDSHQDLYTSVKAGLRRARTYFKNRK